MPCLAAPRSRLDPLPDAPSARWLCHHHSSAASSRPPVAFDRRTGFSVSLTTSGFPHLASFPCSSPSPTSFLSPSFISNATPNIEGDQQTADDSAMESLPRMITSKYEIDLRERILGGEFSVSYTKSKTRETRQLLMRWGKFGRRLAFVLINWERRYLLRQAQKVPEAKGNVRSITGQPFFIPLYDLYMTYGGIFRLTFGPKSFLIISDPVIAKHLLKDNSKAYSKGILGEILDFVMGKGLIPADGEVWRVRRRAIVPALHRKVVFGDKTPAFVQISGQLITSLMFSTFINITSFSGLQYVSEMVGLFGSAAENLCHKLETAAKNGEDVEMESLFSRLTLDIIGKAVFNFDFNSLSRDTGIVKAVYTVLREAEDRSVALIPYWNIPIIKHLSRRQQKVTASLKLVNKTLDELIGTCKRIVDEEKVDFEEDYMNERDPSILHFLLASGDDVSSKQLRDDLMTLLIAGHETSAAVLTWAFYLLSQNPKVLHKLQQEVDLVLGDRRPTIEDMKRLKYTTRVINETLRLYPQPPVLIRRSLEKDVLGKYLISKGEDIFISVWNLHRSPALWEDPEVFKPERWPLDGLDPTEVTEKFRYLPFGGGPRKCVGDMFATFENITAVAMIARRFNCELALGAPPVNMTTGATIHTTAGLYMTVTPRMKPPIIPVVGDPKVTTVDENGSVKSFIPSTEVAKSFIPSTEVAALDKCRKQNQELTT